jgi:hypothetical protein
MSDIGEVVLLSVNTDSDLGLAISYQDLLLAWVCSGPVWILLERETIQLTPDITAASQEFIVTPGTREQHVSVRYPCHLPCPTKSSRLLENDKVL